MADALKLVAVIAVIGMSTAYALPADRPPARAEALRSSDASTVVRVADEILSQRKEQAAALIEIIKDRQLLWREPAAVQAAVRILGDMRAVEAIEPLLAIVGYPEVRPAGGPPIRSYSYRTGWPAPWWGPPDDGSPAEALIKIGEPCLRSVVGKIRETDNQHELEESLKVLLYLRGRDAAAAYLKAQIAGQGDAPGARLPMALDLLAQAPEKIEVPPQYRAYVAGTEGGVQGLLAKDQPQIHASRDALLASREALVSDLVGIISDPDRRRANREGVRSAIAVLGAMRAPEAIEPLLDIVVYENTEAEPRGMRVGLSTQRVWWERQRDDTPVGALIQIGDVCIPNVVARLAQTDDGFKRLGYLWVLRNLCEWEDAAHLIYVRMHKEVDPEQRRHLTDALAELNQMSPPGEIPVGIREQLERMKEGERPRGRDPQDR